MEMQTILQDVSLSYDREDKWLWGVGQNKSFTVKTCYNWQNESVAGNMWNENADILLACAKARRCDVPTKAIVLSWRLFINRQPTRDALIRRRVINSKHESCCVSCFNNDATAQHLFFGCCKTVETWNIIAQWLQVPVSNSYEPVQHFVQFGQQLKGRKLKGLKHLIWIATVWAIWCASNKSIFEGSVFNVSSIVNHIKHLSWEWFIAGKGRKSKLNYED